MNRRKRILSLLLVMGLCLALLPGAAWANITYYLGQKIPLSVGETYNLMYFADAVDSSVPVQLISTGDTLPPGLYVEKIFDNIIGLGGTPAAGTVGNTYYVYLKQEGGADDGETGTVEFEIQKGRHTIVQPDIYWPTGSGNVQLAPYSLNMSGQRITGLHDPSQSYIYSGGDPGIATVDATGLVTIHGWGVTQITISTDNQNLSYEAASKTVTIQVGDLSAPIPQTGDNNHLAGWTAALLISAAGLGALLMQSKRQRGKKAR